MRGNYRQHHLLSSASATSPSSSSSATLPAAIATGNKPDQQVGPGLSTLAKYFTGESQVRSVASQIHEQQPSCHQILPASRQLQHRVAGQRQRMAQDQQAARLAAKQVSGNFDEPDQRLGSRQTNSVVGDNNNICGSQTLPTTTPAPARQQQHLVAFGQRYHEQLQTAHPNRSRHQQAQFEAHQSQGQSWDQRQQQQPAEQLHHFRPSKSQAEPDGEGEFERALCNGQLEREQYASQLRRQQQRALHNHHHPHHLYQYQHQHHQHHQQPTISAKMTNSHQGQSYQSSGQQQTTATSQPPAGSEQDQGSVSQPANRKQSGGQQAARESLHVNFNRAGQAHGAAEEEEEAGESRKKKYLTAKYGQQQMNLIKKRLKIEMWLHEQLRELARGSKSKDELDELDIDLDQLLDMDDDEMRRHWLRKTLEPFDDLPGDRLEKFICDVLEQSKLL